MEMETWWPVSMGVCQGKVNFRLWLSALVCLPNALTTCDLTYSTQVSVPARRKSVGLVLDDILFIYRGRWGLQIPWDVRSDDNLIFSF